MSIPKSWTLTPGLNDSFVLEWELDYELNDLNPVSFLYFCQDFSPIPGDGDSMLKLG